MKNEWLQLHEQKSNFEIPELPALPNVAIPEVKVDVEISFPPLIFPQLPLPPLCLIF